jgi:NADH-quinone oxidoreductase subunit G
VGALTSKPFRYSARSWELKDMPSVSPHDCVGSNLNVQVRRNQIMRVLPRENEDVNEVWISDRDRFSYDAVNNSDARLLRPMIRSNGQWQETDWRTALEFAAGGVRKIVGGHGPDQLGALAAPQSTVEELYLLQKLVHKLGSANVDHRLRARDVSDDAQAPVFPWLGQSIRELETLDAALLVGAYTRKDQPLINHRLRKASLNGAKIAAVNPVDWSFNFPLHAKAIGTPAQMLSSLGAIVKAMGKQAGRALPASVEAWVAGIEVGSSEQAIAHALQSSTRKAVLLGSFAASHPAAASLRALAELIADLSEAKLGYLPEANGAGAWLAGCVPHRGPAGEAVAKQGQDAYAMLTTPLKGYIVLAAEPEMDSWDGAQARRALDSAEFVISLSAFKTAASEYADVLLPIAPFTETSGTFVNCEGRWQSFAGAVAPAGEARPAWKVLRVLGNLLELPGFEYNSSEEVLAEVKRDVDPAAKSQQRMFTAPTLEEGAVVRILEVPIYTADSIVRRSRPLKQTVDHQRPLVRMNAALSAKLGLDGQATVKVEVGGGQAALDLVLDPRVPDGCVVIPSGFSETATLSAYGAARISRM